MHTIFLYEEFWLIPVCVLKHIDWGFCCQSKGSAQCHLARAAVTEGRPSIIGRVKIEFISNLAACAATSKVWHSVLVLSKC